jgi:large subunit ribosomal protein L10
MPRPEKVQAVEEIRERLAEARAMFVTEYRGLSVSEQQSLRAELRKADGDYKVVKMSLARLAADAEGLEALHDALSGPTALAFARSDAATVAKALRDFAKEHESLIIKAGVLSGEVLAPEKVAELANIEPRDVLLGRVAGGFKAPLTKLAGLLEALPRNAASMFSQLLEKKEEEPTAEPEAATETASAEPEAEAAEPTTDEAEPEAEEPAAEAETEQVAEEKPIEEVEPEAEEPVAEADEPAAGEADEPVAESAEAGDEPEAEPVAEEEPATDAEAGEEAADESEEEEE